MLVIGSCMLTLWSSSKVSALVVSNPQAQGVTISLNAPKALMDNGSYIMPRALADSISHVAKKYPRAIKVDNFGRNASHFVHPCPSQYSNNAISKRADQGSSVLKSYQDFAWTGMVTFDSQELEVVFDSGSAEIVVPGVNCDGCQGHTAFIPRVPTKTLFCHVSTLCRQGCTDKKYTIEYDDGGAADCQVHKASISIGGLTATDVAVGVATRFSPEFSKENFPADGILGLGFSAQSIFKKPTFMDQLSKQKKIRSRVFCFKMGAVRLGSSGSTLDLGWINSELYKGEITYLPVIRQSYWEVTLQSLLVGEEELSLGLTGTGMRAIIDTGRHMVSAPRPIVEEIYKRIPGAKPAPARFEGMWTIPCQNPPYVSLKFSGRKFHISRPLFATARIDDDVCIGGLSVGPEEDVVIVGAVFLSNFYSIFDIDRRQVGFATLRSA